MDGVQYGTVQQMGMGAPVTGMTYGTIQSPPMTSYGMETYSQPVTYNQPVQTFSPTTYPVSKAGRCLWEMRPCVRAGLPGRAACACAWQGHRHEHVTSHSAQQDEHWLAQKPALLAVWHRMDSTRHFSSVALISRLTRNLRRRSR